MKLILIAAMTQDRVIGANGAMPWRSKLDLQRFRRMTVGWPVIMGRKTHASIGKLLDGRGNIVISRSMERDPQAPPTLHVVRDWQEALRWAQFDVLGLPEPRAFIIGGGSIYQQALELQLDQLELTFIEDDYAGDTYFPELDMADWQLVSEQRHPEAEPPLRFCSYERSATDSKQ